MRLFLLDDHEVVRKGLRCIFEAEADMEVVGEASTAAEALDRIPAARPTVAILDVRLAGGDGVAVCRDVKSIVPEVACLMLTSFPDDDALLDAVMAGASGYVLKDIRAKDLLRAVRLVAGGQSLIDPVLTTRLFDRIRAGADADPRLRGLTSQERRILDLIAEGKTNREIAEVLFLAEKTVKNYVSKLLKKLEMHRRTEAAVFVVRTEQFDRSAG